MPDMPPLSAQLVTRDQIARIDKGKDYGPCAGLLTLDAAVGTHVLDATGPLAVTLPMTVPDWAFFTLLCTSGGTGVSVSGVDAWPLGEPGAADVFVCTFQRLRGKWLGFPAGGGTMTEPDTSAPSQPALKASTITDTSVTMTVTRGVDDESNPTLKGRYYPQGAATKPDFAPITLTAGAWLVDGLSQNSPYVFEVHEVSQGGTSATTTVTVTTAKTKGWIVSSSATFDAPDGTDLSSLKMSDGQAIVCQSNGAATTTITGNRILLASAPNQEYGAADVTMPAARTLAQGRIRVAYEFLPGSNFNTGFTLSAHCVGGTVGTIGVKLSGDGSLVFEIGNSNAQWETPTWTGATTGLDPKGTFGIGFDTTTNTASAFYNGQPVGTIHATDGGTVRGIDAAYLHLGQWNDHGGMALDQVDIMTYQS